MDSNGTALNTNPEEGAEKTATERTCRICGCTDSKPCEGGCSWVIHGSHNSGICSECISEAVPECIDFLVEIIEKVHQDNSIDEDTPTVDLCIKASKIAVALRQ